MHGNKLDANVGGKFIYKNAPKKGYFSSIFCYSWIARPVQLHKKSICQISERVTKDPRPPLESSQKGASKWGWVQFVKLFFGGLFFLTPQKLTFQNVPTPI